MFENSGKISGKCFVIQAHTQYICLVITTVVPWMYIISPRVKVGGSGTKTFNFYSKVIFTVLGRVKKVTCGKTTWVTYNGGMRQQAV